MDNTFKSLIAAAGIFAAGVGEPIKAQMEEISGERVKRTKDAVVEAITSLDPDKYPAAIRKFQEIKGYTEDNTLTAAEYEETIKAAKTFEQLDKKRAETIISSLLDTEKIAATVINVEKDNINGGKLSPPGTKSRIIKIDGDGIEKGKDGWILTGLSRKGRINKITSDSEIKGSISFDLVPAETIGQDYVSISHFVTIENKELNTIKIGGTFEIENINGAVFLLEIATLGPDKKTFMDLEKLNLGSSGEINTEIKITGPVRVRLILQKIPFNLDKSELPLPDGKLKVRNFNLTELKS